MEITKAYLQKKFLEYYQKAELKVRELERREWAFVPVKAIPDFVMHRHIAFSSYRELKAYILSNPPLHAYHSSAYYEKPGEGRMEDKEWIKADLIFDIDADHIPVRNASTFEGMRNALEIAKREIMRLYNLLERDFGVKKAEIVFSGSRGYHIHVHDEEFLSLDSAERREIVNYFTLNRVFPDSSSTQKERLCRCATKLLLLKIKRGEVKNERLIRKLSKKTLKELASCNLSALSKRETKVFEKCFNECVEKLKIHIDEPVTADTHRLIRLQNSLHGKTGFIVKPLKVNELEEFDPFRDAIAFGSESVKIRCIKPAKLSIGDVKVKIKAGEKTVMPEYAAVFLMCRGLALYGH